jgi:hypothetical protein
MPDCVLVSLSLNSFGVQYTSLPCGADLLIYLHPKRRESNKFHNFFVMMCFGKGSYYLKSYFSACLKTQNLLPSWCVKKVLVVLVIFSNVVQCKSRTLLFLTVEIQIQKHIRGAPARRYTLFGEHCLPANNTVIDLIFSAINGCAYTCTVQCTCPWRNLENNALSSLHKLVQNRQVWARV